MKKILLVLGLALILTTKGQAQVAVNVGYQESEVFSSVTVGALLNNFDFAFFLGDPDLGDESNFVVGGRAGYMFYLYNDFNTAFYVGPHLGMYFLERTNFNGNGFEESEGETSLNYGITAGVYFNPVNLAVEYGIDDLFETEYIGFKIGFNIMEIMGG